MEGSRVLKKNNILSPAHSGSHEQEGNYILALIVGSEPSDKPKCINYDHLSALASYTDWIVYGESHKLWFAS
jgi:hypothetical protein